jgi:hypothetical protein
MRWNRRLDRAQHFHRDRVRRRRAGVARHDHVGCRGGDFLHDTRNRKTAGLCVEQAHIVSRIQQAPTDHEQPEGDLMTDPEVRRDGLVRGIDQQDAHGLFSALYRNVGSLHKMRLRFLP